MEDIHIINLFLERSEDAIRQVEVKYEKFCFKIAWNILYNTEDSEECVNDTWLITWNKIPPKTPTKLSAFLGKITRNLALDNFRKKNASKRADTHMMDICGEVEKLENTIKDYVEEGIKKKEILNILEKFLSDLKDLLSSWDDVPYKETIKNINTAIKNINDFNNGDGLIFVHSREPKEIQRYVNYFGSNTCHTLLVKNPNVPTVTSNHADKDVENYRYDFVVYNNKDLESLEDKAKLFYHHLFEQQIGKYIYD